LNPGTLWAIYTTGSCSALTTCGVSFSWILRRTGNAQETEIDKSDVKVSTHESSNTHRSANYNSDRTKDELIRQGDSDICWR